MRKTKEINEESFDGKWVLTTDTSFPIEQVVLKYQELWQLGQVFQDMKSILDTRTIFNQRDANHAGSCLL